jgi:hypothetical protein
MSLMMPSGDLSVRVFRRWLSGKLSSRGVASRSVAIGPAAGPGRR